MCKINQTNVAATQRSLWPTPLANAVHQDNGVLMIGPTLDTCDRLVSAYIVSFAKCTE